MTTHFPIPRLAKKQLYIPVLLLIFMQTCFAEPINIKQATQLIEHSFKKHKDLFHLGNAPKGIDDIARYLTPLVFLEKDLMLLKTTNESIVKEVENSEVDASKQKEIIKIRQEVLKLEHERIIKSGLKPDSKSQKSLQKKLNSLDSIYDKLTKKQTQEINQISKKLAKESASRIPSFQTIRNLKNEIKELEEFVSNIHKAVYSFHLGEGFRAQKTHDGTSELDKLLSEIISEREIIFKNIRKEIGEGEKKAGYIEGIYIYSENLGVLLDVSGSMTKHLYRLRRQIDETFTSPQYQEITGCSLTLSGHSKSRTIAAIETLLITYGVDTVYWFCDLQDPRTESALRHLQWLFRKSGAKFHIKSVGKRPDKELKRLISG